jgi:hypothetical protein
MKHCLTLIDCAALAAGTAQNLIAVKNTDGTSVDAFTFATAVAVGTASANATTSAVQTALQAAMQGGAVNGVPISASIVGTWLVVDLISDIAPSDTGTGVSTTATATSDCVDTVGVDGTAAYVVPNPDPKPLVLAAFKSALQV